MRRGFTLVELVVAMALTSLLGLMAYALFGISADNLVELDSLEKTSSKGRFGVEKLRNMFQIAGSFSSPDSVSDPFVQPSEVTPSMRVAGFQAYSGWQDQQPLGTDYPDLSFDGVVLTGAFDFPTSFEAGGFTSGSTSLKIPGNFLGMEKLVRVDPFSDVQERVGDSYYPDLSKRDWGNIDSYRFLEQDLGTRLVRVTDGMGYVQFFRPNVGAGFSFVTSDLADMNLGGTRKLYGIDLPLDQNAPFKPVFKGDRTDTVNGLEMREIGIEKASAGEGDRTYDASLIDTYWLRVVPGGDPRDPTNYLLVLDRLCAGKLAEDGPVNGPINPANALPTTAGCGTNSRKLIADRVVDFQVWFDCVDASGDVSNNPNWTQDWLTPDGTAPGGNCMSPGPNYAPGRARAAHARITLRTDEERSTFPHQPFVDGDTLCTSSAACPSATLRSFDINPQMKGAAPVVTFQTDIALRNFIIKDIQ